MLEESAYHAVALQVATHAVNPLGVAEAREVMLASIDRIADQARGARSWVGPECRLIVLPEYVLSGFPLGDTVPGWREKAALDPDGPEYEKFAALAAELGVHLVVNAYESDRHFPDLYFQASVILGPTGDVVLRYRRLHSLYSPSPFDVWDRYLDTYGIDAVLPVARTAIGNLAAIASEEILYPELARALGLRGAEVFVHSTSEVTSPQLTPKAIARRARAIENMAYVVSANSGGLRGIAIPGDSTSGGSEILDHEGRVLAQAASGESIVAYSEIDLAAVRRARKRPGMLNLPSRVKTGLWAQEYARHDIERPNSLEGRTPERSFFAERQAAVLDRLAAARESGAAQEPHREPSRNNTTPEK
ncbi:nitrilase-related carbon-nitrogen hydrolase [Ornithinimicrobium faecis]|uniref:nitrilase-related carbon-nitrogen hydrolase n=1 Tax=Ornithinimicrobium faecis TaxID=2934158 RepID=UPI00211992F1|nr:nitrilase-related carbon-nitrogen hydrolase [Ornithinimicrobium sp. HY1745]